MLNRTMIRVVAQENQLDINVTDIEYIWEEGKTGR